jgi:FAD/FMN-containing dehydrogenase
MRAAMTVTPEIVALGPVAVELVDRTMIDLARHNPLFAPTIDGFFDASAAALLLVEFAGDEYEPLSRELRRLGELLAEPGPGEGFVEALEPGFQASVWEIRKAGLNILMLESSLNETTDSNTYYINIEGTVSDGITPLYKVLDQLSDQKNIRSQLIPINTHVA